MRGRRWCLISIPTPTFPATRPTGGSSATNRWRRRYRSTSRFRLRRVTEDVLAEKGLEPAPAPPQTDLLLTYYFNDKDEVRINQVSWGAYSPWGYGYWSGYSYGYTEVRSYKQGTLVLDIVDAHTHKLVWTGTLEKEIRSANPPGDRVEKSVAKLLKNFPPK